MAVTGVGVAAAGTVAGAAAVGTKAPVAREAVVTAGPCHAGLAGAVASAGVTESAGAQGEYGRSHGVAGARFAGVWGREGLPEVAVEAQLAALAVLPFRVVLTVVADTATAIARCQPRIHVKMTSVGMPITLARLTLFGGSSFAVGSLPRLVVVERGAVLAVGPCGVVLAHAFPMDHMENTRCLDGLESSDRDAVVSMAIAEAAALHDEVIDGIVQGWWGLWGWAGREAGAALPLQQPHPQVGDLQLRLGFHAVWVLRGIRR